MSNSIFRGCGTAVITPFHETDFSINYEEFGHILEFQIENGVDAIIVCGTTGEASAMPDEEHIEVIRYAVDVVNKRVPVIAGAGSNYTKHAIDLSLEAQNAGADALLHVTPYYNKTSQQGLILHFNAIADAVSIPMMLYSVPSRTGMGIQPETYLELSKHKNIVATKEASGNFTLISTAMQLCGDTLDFYSGNDDNTVPLFALGAKGVVSVLSNVKPKETADLCRMALNGDFSGAAKAQLSLMPLINALFCDVSPMPVKEAMNAIGFAAGLCRQPLYKLSDAKREALRALL